MIKSLRTCPRGHHYHKSSDCPTCPYCEIERKPESGFLTMVSAPARRALERDGITDLSKLAEWTEKELLGLHGIGPSAIPKLRLALNEAGLAFK